jgi:hypothetical protein
MNKAFFKFSKQITGCTHAHTHTYRHTYTHTSVSLKYITKDHPGPSVISVKNELEKSEGTCTLRMKMGGTRGSPVSAFSNQDGGKFTRLPM